MINDRILVVGSDLIQLGVERSYQFATAAIFGRAMRCEEGDDGNYGSTAVQDVLGIPALTPKLSLLRLVFHCFSMARVCPMSLAVA